MKSHVFSSCLYMAQDDVMFPNVTVKEQVMFHTVLKTQAPLDDPKSFVESLQKQESKRFYPVERHAEASLPSVKDLPGALRSLKGDDYESNGVAATRRWFGGRHGRAPDMIMKLIVHQVGFAGERISCQIQLIRSNFFTSALKLSRPPPIWHSFFKACEPEPRTTSAAKWCEAFQAPFAFTRYLRGLSCASEIHLEGRFIDIFR